ncbi:LysM peptidoglycan-binding domain-containing protein [Pimelobacter simplex]|uniref:LysM peptidoglycan-binding domain-containing protein n=1 Tax=Nocardioides simplex TaxID=2045 RepID=UPI003AAD29EE
MEHVLASPVAAPAAARRRGLLLWVGVSAGSVLGGMLAGPAAVGLVRPSGAAVTFADLLVGLCAVVALVALGGLWLAASDVAWTVLRPARLRPRLRARRVGPVRAGLLALCGVTAFAAPVSASAGTPEPAPPPAVLDTGVDADADALAGLPLPERPVDGPAPARCRTVQVRPGDTLWAIAARALGPEASAADVTAYWRRIHACNAPVIGPDPDRILPGQVLHLP